MIAYNGIDKDFSLAGKTAVITGGAAGIGLAAARFFGSKGANLVLADLNPEADAIAKSVGGQHVGLSGDVRDREFRESVLGAAKKAFGGADVLLNSAGIALLDKAEAISGEMWAQTLDVNLTAGFLMAQLFGQYWIGEKRPGCIINMASQAGVVALDRHVAYCASKGAIIAMTKVLAMEWGKYDIRVNAVSPTVVLTELGHRAWDGPVGDAFKKEMPAERFAEPEEIAAIIGFLASGPAAMITGHNLVVDGGYTIK